MTLTIAGPHAEAVWADIADVRQRIDSLTFLREMAGGTLDPRAFANYILQDAFYLAGYSRALALLSSRAPQPGEQLFWAQSAGQAIAEEKGLHEALLASEEFGPAAREILGDRGRAALESVASPTTVGYTSYLIAAAASAPYEVAVAAVLPCYWVYADVGHTLTSELGDTLRGHPYEAWIAAYGDPAFDAVTEGAIAIFERAASDADEATRARMRETFRRASIYEHDFWNTAYAQERWE